MLLEVRELDVRYGRVHAVRGVSLRLRQGEIVAVLGANGAGKSSLLRALLGIGTARRRTVTFDGDRCHELASQAAGSRTASFWFRKGAAS